MHVRLNGADKEFPDALSVEALLKHLGLKRTGIAVEVNRNIIRKGDYAATRLGDGDVVEIVTFVGGG